MYCIPNKEKEAGNKTISNLPKCLFVPTFAYVCSFEVSFSQAFKGNVRGICFSVFL